MAQPMFRIPLTGPDSEDPKLAARPATKLAVKKTAPAPHYAKVPAPEEYQSGPFIMPSDIIKKMFIEDTRTTNPATGLPFKTKGPKSVYANPANLKAVIAHAKAKGVDPYTALAIDQQESEFGTIGDIGQVLDYQPDENLFTNVDRGANVLAKALKDKLEYAKRLGYDKKGLDYALQAYNGYGKIDGNDMSKNPTYGKVVVSLLENLKKNPEIKKMIEETPAYGQQAENNKVMLKIAKK